VTPKQVREAFEAWYRAGYPRLSAWFWEGRYQDPHTQSLWESWKAAHAWTLETSHPSQRAVVEAAVAFRESPTFGKRDAVFQAVAALKAEGEGSATLADFETMDNAIWPNGKTNEI